MFQYLDDIISKINNKQIVIGNIKNAQIKNK